jgi:hypothetical protein
MDSPIQVFSNWAINGKDEGMETGHANSVQNMLDYSTKGLKSSVSLMLAVEMGGLLEI